VATSDEHITAFLKAFEIAQKLRAPHNMMVSAFRIAHAYLNKGDDESFNLWVSIAVEIHEMSPSNTLSALMHALICRQAIGRGLRESAFMHLEAFTKYGSHSTIQDRRYLLCLRGAIELIQEDWLPDDDFLNETISLTRRLARFPLSDYASSVAAQLLHRAGKAAEAKEMLVHYLTSERREARSPSAYLQESCRLIGLDPALYMRPAHS
jgi:hypothetical protein